MHLLDHEALHRIRDALSTQYSPSATRELRMAAQEALDDFANSSLAPMYGYYLAHMRHNFDEITRFYGLKCIETTIKFHWSESTCRDEEKAKIVAWMEDMALTGLGAFNVEQKLIKEKVASILVELTKREWPGRWQFADFLVRLWNFGIVQQELALLTLRTLSEDIHDTDFADHLITARKQELLVLLNSIVYPVDLFRSLREKEAKVRYGSSKDLVLVPETTGPGWLERILNSLATYYEQLKSQKINSSDIEQVQHIVILLLDVLERFVSWVHATALISLQILPSLCVCFDLPILPIRIYAARCLNTVCGRSYNSLLERLELFDPFFNEGGLEIVASVFKSIAGNLEVPEYRGVTRIDNEGLNLLKLLVESITKLGTQHLCWKKNLSWKPDKIRTYYDLLLYTSNHPSATIGGITNQFWIAAVKHDFFSKDPAILTAIPALLSALLPQLRRKAPAPGTLEEYFVDLEFESSGEYLLFISRYINNVRMIIKAVAEWKPLESFIWITSKVEQLLKQPLIDKRGINEKGLYQNTAPYFALFDSHMVLLDVVSQSICVKATEEQKAQITVVATSLVDLLLSSSINDPLLQRSIASGVASCVEHIKGNANLTRQSVAWIFELMKKLLPEGDDSASNTAALLPRIAPAVAGAVMPYYGEIHAIIQSIVTQSHSSCSFAQSYEFLVIIIYHSDISVVEKRQKIGELVTPFLENWQSLANTSFRSLQEFMKSVGVDFLYEYVMKSKQATTGFSLDKLPAETVDSFYGSRVFSNKLLQLTTIVGMFLARGNQYLTNNKSETDLWGDYLAGLSDLVLAQIKILDQFQDPTNWSELPLELRQIINIIPLCVKQSLLPRQPNLSPYHSHACKIVSFQDMIGRIQNWIDSIRLQTYNVLRHLCYHPVFYSLPKISSQLTSSVFSNIAAITYRQWHFLIHYFLESFVSQCPPDKREDVLMPLVPLLIRYLFEKMDRDWKNLVAQGEHGIEMLFADDEEDREGEGEITNDIIRQKVFVNFTRAYSEMLMKWLFNGKPSKHSKKEDNPKPLMQYVLSRPELMEPLFLSAVQLMTYRDTVSATKAVVLCKEITHETSSNPAFFSFLGNDMLSAALNALHSPHHIEIQTQIVTLITQVYVSLRSRSDSAFNVLVSIPGFGLEKIQEFDAQLMQAESKYHDKLMHSLLKDIIGVSLSEKGKKNLSFTVTTPAKLRVFRTETGSNDVLTQENAGLNALFGE